MGDVGKTILQQLGGSRFIAMTGTKNLVGGKDYLMFSIPRGNRSRGNKIKITLDEMDTYSVRAYNVKGIDAKLTHEREMIYAENLRLVFTTITGLYTNL